MGVPSSALLSNSFAYNLNCRQAGLKTPSRRYRFHRPSLEDVPQEVAMKALFISADHFEGSELLFPFCQRKEVRLEVGIASIGNNGVTA